MIYDRCCRKGEGMKKLRYMHWQIAYRTEREAPFCLVENPPYAWAADPFLVEYKGDVYLFAELFLYRSERNGVIGYCRYENGRFGKWQVSMDEHWHLSYPNVFVREGELFMCPESWQKNEVGIYRLVEFPDKWEQTECLFRNVRYVDTTFLEQEGERYIFTFAPDFIGDEGRLLLFREKRDGSVTGPVTITSDTGVARPGGTIIWQDGKWFRVSQNCRNSYGEGLVFSEIDSLWPEYREHVVRRISPGDLRIETKEKVLGVHTYNRLGAMEVIDIKFYAPSFSEYLAAKRTHKVFLNKYEG